MIIDELMVAPVTPETGQALLDWVGALRGRILRGDMMIGILPIAEVNKAPAALRKAAECGHPLGLLELASWLADPPFGDSNPEEAQAVLRNATASGVARADIHLVRLLWFYRRDTASEAERREAHDLLLAATARDPRDAEAFHLLGLLTCQGFGATADPTAAVRCQQVAAALGSAPALFELFIHHQMGLGVPRDEKLAVDFLRRAAEAGHPRAMYNMGALHAAGQYFAKDSVAAAKWYRRASEAGNAQATAMLGVMYAQGDGVGRDVEYARQLFAEAESWASTLRLCVRQWASPSKGSDEAA